MVEGKAIVKFGAGDILVTPLILDDFSMGFINLQNQEAKPVGSYTTEFEPDKDDTVLCFPSIESLDVVIERLNCLRDMMQGILPLPSLPVIEFDYSGRNE